MRPGTHSRHSVPITRLTLPFVLLAYAGCGGDAPPAADNDASSADQTASAPSGSLRLGSDSLTFRVVRCVPVTDGEGLQLRGAGSAPDGRPLIVEVEHRPDGERIDEVVTVIFGSIMEGDVWSADAHRFPDGRWSSEEVLYDPLEGPLLQIDGRNVRASGTFQNDGSGQEREGELTATCPA